jgi:formylglycine-generating enzyme required for sulfatase activity/chromosomal replication initiation ATPase DnaA
MVVSKVGVVDVKIPIKPGVKKVTEEENSFSNQILILFSSPLLNENLSPVENLSIQEEINAIASVLEDISHPISVEIVVKVATSQTIQDVLSNRFQPLIIHFIGHGMRKRDNTALVLEDEVGIARSFTEEELEIALSNQQQVPCQLALLNACHSEKLAQAFVKAGIPHVIAVNAEDKILDVAARCFSRRFYQALFNQDSVSNSFLSGRNAVKLDDKLKKLFNSLTFEQGVNFNEAFKYELLPKGSSHNESLIIEPADSHQVLYPHWSNTNIPREDKNFVGRRKEIHQVIKALVESDKRCIALHGMGGIGKTALAYAIGRWLHERDRYKDGVWFISLRDTDSVGTLITKVKQSLELKSFSLERELRNSRIFLILDDLDKLIEKESNELIELLNLLLEQCSNLRLLLTSRDSLVRDIYCHQEEVCSMGVSETREIFKKYAPPQEKWGNNDDLEQDFHLLAKFLDGYPLPIKLAASYMAETQSTLKMLCEQLVNEPLDILDSYSPEQRKERSLRITLERSFEMLSVEAQDIFPLLAFFPSGLSRDLAKAIWDRSGNKVLLELFKFSMAEKSATASDWRVTLPEPARTYAESKLQKGRKIEYLAPLVLAFYYSNFCDTVLQLFNKRDNKGQQLLLQENSNLILFLEWGYEHETSSDKICRSARLTALLSPYWRWIEANKDPLVRLNLALTATQRNQDREGENLVRNAITALSSREAFKDVQSLGQGSYDIKFFEFETVTVNASGEIIERETKQADYFNEGLNESINIEMIAIPGGTFMMGSPEGEGYESEKPQHQVTIKPFFMGKYLITQAQWRFVAELPQQHRKLNLEPSRFKGDELPVERVSWYDAVEFCDRLSAYTGKSYCLPSEAEWEYACRAGTTTPFHFGETITDELANYNASRTFASEPKGEYRDRTTPVGQFPPNAFGLYDMHGNVWEWCLDDWHDSYEDAPTDGSAWFDDDNNLYQKRKSTVLRGGSWYGNPGNCRSACRLNDSSRDFIKKMGLKPCASSAAFY